MPRQKHYRNKYNRPLTATIAEHLKHKPNIDLGQQLGFELPAKRDLVASKLWEQEQCAASELDI